MNHLRRSCAALSGAMAVFLVAACNTTSAPTSSREPAGANLVTGVQVALGACVTTQPPTGKGLADTVLTSLVSKGVNLLGNALTEAGKDRTWKAMGSRNLPGGSAAFPACVQVVRGRFRTDTPAAEAPWLSQYAVVSNAYELLKTNGLWPADNPDFFFEGAIVTSEDKTAATIRPLLAVLNEPQGMRATGGEERSVVVFFAFSTAGVRPDLGANPAATVVLGSMVPGRTLRFPSGGVDKSSTPYEASWFTLSDADARKPLTVTSLVSETQSGSPFFAFLASIFNDESVKKAITERVNVILVPGVRAAVEETQIKEQRTAADNVDSKLADAIAKLIDCNASGKDALAKGAAAKAALRGYLAADAALPTPLKKIGDADVGLINLYAPDTVASRCNDLHEKLTGKRL